MRPAVGPSYGLFVGRSAKPLDNPARPHWPLPTVHATQAQNQTEDWHECDQAKAGYTPRELVGVWQPV